MPMPQQQANRGRTLEEIIEAVLEGERLRGVACVQKIATPWVPMRHQGKVVGAFPQQSTVDFVGVIRSHPVAFDAKEVVGDRMPWSRVPEHEGRFLHDFAQAGGEAFLLVAWWNHGVYMRAPISTWYETWFQAIRGQAKRGQGSVTFAEAQRVWQPAGSTTGVPTDFCR